MARKTLAPGLLRVTSPRKGLFEGIQTVGKAVATRSSLPIMWCWLLTAVFLSANCLASTQADTLTQTYTITHLGSLPGNTYSMANGISPNGKVTGTSGAGESGYHAFLYNGAIKDLGALPNLPRSKGNSINSGSQVAGTVLYVSPRNPDTGSVSVNSHAFFYDGTMHDLSVYRDGAPSEATALNDRGQVTRYYGRPIEGKPGYIDRQAFLYTNAKMTDIPLPAGGDYSVGNAINKSGQVVGSYKYEKSGNNHGFWYHDGKLVDLNDLVSPQSGWSLGNGTGINDNGQITGFGFHNGASHAFLYGQGAVVDLGALPDLTRINSLAINNHGQVVGAAYPDSGNGKMSDLGASHAFVYSHGKMSDLNTLIDPKSGWFLYEARGINDRGQIVGFGDHQGKSGAFLLTPKR